jgi:NADPH:quinone reductase-like Zn-dependent oxidoreductase
VAVAAPGDEKLVRGLGADEFVARTRGLGAAVRRVVPAGVHGALDAGLAGMPALDAVRDKGAFVAVAAGAAPVPLRGTRVHNVWIHTDGPRLAELAALAEAGQLTARVAATLPLAEVATAHERVTAGGLRGRIVLALDG